MPRDVVALVSDDDFVSAIRVYADRMNDLLERGGVPEDEVVDVAEAQALALLDAVVDAPASVGDLAGWWFGRGIEAVDRTFGVLADECLKFTTAAEDAEDDVGSEPGIARVEQRRFRGQRFGRPRAAFDGEQSSERGLSG